MDPMSVLAFDQSDVVYLQSPMALRYGKAGQAKVSQGTCCSVPDLHWLHM